MTYVGQKPANKPVNQTDIEDDAISLAKLAGGTDGNIISYDASGNPVAIATGNDGQVLTSTGAGSPPAFEALVVPTLRPNANPLIINGDFSIAQRTSSTSSVSSGSNFVSDRFTFGPATAGTWTISQEAITSGSPFDNGFRTGFKADNTTANGSLSAGSNLQFAQKIEAQDLQLLKYGSSNAEKLTLCFWIKATKTGTNVIEIFGHDSSRSVSVAYTVSSSNTWEKKTVLIPADTGGTINNDNGTGLEFIWWLVAGSNFTSGSLQTSWGANSATARAVGQVNHADSTSNNVHITGIQLEVGEYSASNLPNFQHESFGDNLKRCMRYYYRQNGESGFASGSAFVQDGTVKSYQYHTSPVPMRTQVSMSLSNTSGGIIQLDGGASDNITSIGGVNSGSPFQQYTLLIITNGSSITDKCGVSIRINSSHYIEANAEL